MRLAETLVTSTSSRLSFGFQVVHDHAEGRGDERAVILAVQPDARALANLAQIKRVRLLSTLQRVAAAGNSLKAGQRTGRVERDRINRRAGETRCVGVAEFRPRNQIRRDAIRRQRWSAADKFHVPVAGDFGRLAVGLPVIPGRAFGSCFRRSAENHRFADREVQSDIRVDFAALSRDAATPEWPVIGSTMTTDFAGRPRVIQPSKLVPLRLAIK